MKLLKNIILAVKLVFQYAPLNALLLICGYCLPGFSNGLQIILVQRLVDAGVQYVELGEGLGSLVATGTLLVMVLFTWVMLQRLGEYEDRVIESRLAKDMAPDILDKLDRLEYGSFEKKEIQNVLERIGGEPWQNVRSCFTKTVVSVQSVISILFVLGVYMTISTWIGVGLFLVAVPMTMLGFSATRQFHRAVFGTTEEVRRMKDLKLLLQNRNAMYEMKVFGSQELIAEKWKEAGGKVETQIRKAGSKALVLDGASRLMSFSYFVFIIVTLAYSLLQGTVTLGQFAAAIGSIGSITGRLNAASWYVTDAARLALDLEFYQEFLKLPEREMRSVEQKSTVPDKTGNDSGGRRQKKSGSGDIVFENVSFSYPGTEKIVLRNLTFRIKAGERVAFVGENGAGKSTIIRLLCGLYPPDKGRVLIDGVDVREMDEKSLRSWLSVVFQDFQSYQLTLRENVALGDIDGLWQDERICHALRQAGGEALYQTPKGLKLHLGHLEEDGVDLSKGQWQRIAVARVFLSGAAFCVLDEPTASLDPLAESRMYENFAGLFREKGTIMISHRLASAKMADRIMVLDGGRIVQNGSHEILMKEEGLYRAMYLAQSSWYSASAPDADAASVSGMPEAKEPLRQKNADQTRKGGGKHD